MQYIFIVNPVSGNGNSIKAIKAIEEYCKMLGTNYKIIYTNKKNDAKEIAEFYKKFPNTTIFSVGGDGTLNEIVNGMAYSNTKLGIIPAGTGNDFYKTFKDFKEEKIDLGKVNDKYFINVASLGLDCEIANYANILKDKGLSGRFVYILSLIHEYFTYEPINIKISNKLKDTTIFTICNAKYYGGGFQIAPNAILNDGMFDIIDVKSLNKLEIVNLVSKLLRVKHLESEKVNFYRTNSISINSLVPLNCNIDGEIIKGTNFKFSIEKEAINADIENSDKINCFLKMKKIIK